MPGVESSIQVETLGSICFAIFFPSIGSSGGSQEFAHVSHVRSNYTSRFFLKLALGVSLSDMILWFLHVSRSFKTCQGPQISCETLAVRDHVFQTATGATQVTGKPRKTYENQTRTMTIKENIS